MKIKLEKYLNLKDLSVSNLLPALLPPIPNSCLRTKLPSSGKGVSATAAVSAENKTPNMR